MRTTTHFWLINTAGWFIFLLCTGLFFAYFSDNLNIQTLLIQTFAFCYYLPASGLLRKWINQLGWFERKQHARLVVLLFCITFVMSLVGQFLGSLFMMYGLNIMTWETYSVPILLMTTVQNWIILCLWVALYLMLKQMRNNREQRLRQVQLESTLHATELKALKAQLNPHFIFNCLNNMRAMAIDDGEKTREMITNLSEILKYSFQFGDQTQVTVEREIQHVQNYLALEEIQFEQRLSYDFDIDPATTQQLIPTLSIQLLVENAIKHGITNLPSGGHIKIQVSKSENQLRIIVTNTGYLEPNKTNKSTGVGLSNLEKRLQLAHSDRASLHLYSPNAQQVTAEISLPFGGKINE